MARELSSSRVRIFPLKHPSLDNSDNVHHGRRDSWPRMWLLATATALLLSQLVTASNNPHKSQKLVRGQVTTGDGHPVMGATVGIFDFQGTQLAESVTDQAGKFTIPTDAAPGEYDLVVANGAQLNDRRIRLGAPDVAIKLPTSAAPARLAHQSAVTVSARQLATPARVRNLVARAQEAFNKGGLAEAGGELNSALLLDPTCSEAWAMRAFVKLAAKDSSGAIADASQAMLVDAGNASAYLALGTAYNSLQDFESAESALHRALELTPDSWQAQLEIAKTWYGQKRFVLALQQLERIDRDFPDVHLVRANVLMSLERQQQGAEEFRTFLREAPADSRSQRIHEILAQVQASDDRHSNRP
jgi:tetratricopeptide (TPR) repeat protein